MLANITFLKALVSPGIIPLILSGVVAAIDYHYQTRPDNRKNQRSRARWMFLLTARASMATSASIGIETNSQGNCLHWT
ncbi:MAG TPA: hypothetical protein VG347_14535 [Verrucomicrobiae bacterium]|nr:hypothetical protein [Verrucomicrobiae bacterium]